MAWYLAKRLLSTAFVVFGLVCGVFLLTRVVPADPARMAAGLQATPEQVAAVRDDLGLNQPLLQQFTQFVGQLAQGDFGRSFVTQRAVMDDIVRYFPATVELVAWAMAGMVALGLSLGIYSAVARSRAPKVVAKLLALAAMGVPVFLLALLSQIIFYGALGWLPSGGRISGDPPPATTNLYTVDTLLVADWSGWVSAVAHLILPAGSLALYRAGMIMRFVESEMRQQMSADYTRTARSKGVTRSQIVVRHVLPNSLPPVVSMVGLEFGWLLGGTVLVESIFSWPGIGNYMVQSITALDFYPVIACTFVLGLSFALINLIVDLAHKALDPRLMLA